MNSLRNPVGMNFMNISENDSSVLDDMIMYENQHSSVKYKKILQDLRSNDPGKMVHGITLLCTELSVIENPNESSFPIDAFIPEILKCMRKEANPDIMSKKIEELSFSPIYFFNFRFLIYSTI